MKDIVHNFYTANGRPLRTADLHCFLDCILKLASSVSLQGTGAITIHHKPVNVEQVMNEITKILGILENTEIKEEIFTYVAKVCQIGVMGANDSDPCTRICEELHMNYKPLTTRQESSFSQWSSFITNDNLLVYQEVDNCIYYK